MKLRNKIHTYIENHKDEITEILKEMIKIPSVKGEASKEYPNGLNAAKMLDFCHKLYRDNGFETELNHKEGYLVSYFGEGKKTLGMFSHADVVAPGEAWVLTNPFEPKEIDGYLIGRGAKDDKSAVLISLYCAKMLKELSIPFNSRLIMFTGNGEETGMEDLKNYLKSHEAPDFTIINDNEFPLYRGNKGKIVFKATNNSPLKGIKHFEGGEHGTNVAKATAVLDYSDEIFNYYKSKENDNFKISLENGDIILKAFGISKHAAFPEGSVNAAAIIAENLKNCELLPKETRGVCKFISGVCGDYYGKYLGIDNSDPEFGKLTIVNDEIEANESCITLSFNLRHGTSINQAETIEKLKSEFLKEDFEVKISDSADAHLTEKNHPMLLAIKETYEEYTGEKVKEMGVNPSGTYGRLLPYAAEIGLSLNINDKKPPFSLPVGHGEIHQPDEYLDIEGFFKAMELTMLMLLKCDNTDI